MEKPNRRRLGLKQSFLYELVSCQLKKCHVPGVLSREPQAISRLSYNYTIRCALKIFRSRFICVISNPYLELRSIIGHRIVARLFRLGFFDDWNWSTLYPRTFSFNKRPPVTVVQAINKHYSSF